MNRRAFIRIWIPVAVTIGFYLLLGLAVFGDHKHGGSGGSQAARPPALFQNGEVVGIAGGNQRARIIAHRWDGHGYVYALEPIK